MRFKKFRGFLCLFHVVLCAMVFNQHSFAGTWTDAFEDDNTQEWELFNTLDEEEAKWWIDRGEAVAETFEPHHDLPTVWSTGELDWKAYSLSCRAKLVKAKDKLASLGLILHQRREESSFYICEIFYSWKTVYITKYTGRASTLGEFDFAGKLNRWYALTASIDSRGKLKFQIDDEVFTVTDKNPIKSGKAGLIVSGAQARFDDVKITGSNIPDGGPGTLPVEPSGKLAITWGKFKRQ